MFYGWELAYLHKKNIVLLIFQIVCRVYTCFEGKCNTVKCPTDSLPYKPGVKVCNPNS